MQTIDKQHQDSITPQLTLSLLIVGNEKLVNNLRLNRNLLQQVNEARDGQWAFAVTVSSIESRTSAELIFDQGLGDIFSIRIAGNIINEDILGSMEFVCKSAGAKFIVVLGHTKCGAIIGTCDKVEMGNLTALLQKISPSVEAENTTTENRNSSDINFFEKVSSINVKHSVNEIIQRSPILMKLIEAGEVGIIGAMYEVEPGKVQFYEETKIIN